VFDLFENYIARYYTPPIDSPLCQACGHNHCHDEVLHGAQLEGVNEVKCSMHDCEADEVKYQCEVCGYGACDDHYITSTNRCHYCDWCYSSSPLALTMTSFVNQYRAIDRTIIRHHQRHQEWHHRFDSVNERTPGSIAGTTGTGACSHFRTFAPLLPSVSPFLTTAPTVSQLIFEPTILGRATSAIVFPVRLAFIPWRDHKQ
jgi:hypothetical protein